MQAFFVFTVVYPNSGLFLSKILKTLVKIDAANAIAERNEQNNATTLLLNKTSYFPIAPNRLNQI
ncbi:MAG: hypothetical protein EAZ32_15885 [Cytophagia bacterium]|nr:MAG: hypothetical protein EAZ38_16880 [Cytophagales bacterium]TAG37316.1 MAG: hypothetical protein EAZ32_15885 [Cytophagia bacterium]TAG49879.1 MAG: hypothetical protein EAZ29_12845 [Runella slithyformis]TAG78282.1 MAG: hypothetical protein EAZ22_13950 [Cytophagales bacterium]